MIRWKVGEYLRLSHEDEEKDKEESNSISNQRDLIDRFLKDETNIKIVDYYIDDGFTGTDFNRPGFQRLLTDIKNGKINTVVVKDLSRLGRNYIEVGNYIEQIFPLYDIRFIAINDNIDSFKDPSSTNNIIVPFKNVMNDEYARDISKKVRSTFDTSRVDGKFIGISAPYGYLKDPMNHHNFIIDNKASKVVKKIFRMLLKGKSKLEVRDELNRLKIAPPAMYKMEASIINHKKYDSMSEWNTEMIDRIVQNRVYIGDLIQKKRKRVNHRIHKLVYQEESERIIVHNHHAPLVSKEDFEKVNELLYGRDIRANGDKTYDIFAGHLRCADCGNTLTKTCAKNHEYYHCSSYRRNKQCTKHSINRKKLEEAVLSIINNQIELLYDVDNKIEQIIREEKINYDREILTNKLNEINDNIYRYRLLKESLRSDYLEKYITETEYKEYEFEYNESLQILEQEKIENEENLKKVGFKNEDNKKWIELFTNTKHLTSLSKNVIDELVDYIYVHEDGEVTISFNYNDKYEEAINFIKTHNHDIISQELVAF